MSVYAYTILEYLHMNSRQADTNCVLLSLFLQLQLQFISTVAAAMLQQALFWLGCSAVS